MCLDRELATGISADKQTVLDFDFFWFARCDYFVHEQEEKRGGKSLSPNP